MRRGARLPRRAPGARGAPLLLRTRRPHRRLLFEILRASDRVAHFAAAFTSASAAGNDGGGFLEGFLRFLLTASAAAHRSARFRSCQIISEIIMQLPDDAEVSDEIWDELIDAMKVRVQDKIPAIRYFAVCAVSHFAIDKDDGGIIHVFLDTLEKEQNAKEVRKTIILSLPPSNLTLKSIIQSKNESVRRAAYFVLSTKSLNPKSQYQTDDDSPSQWSLG